MRARADPPRLAEVEHVGEHVVVAGVDLHAVDLREVVVVGLLDADDVVELRELGEQLVGEVLPGPLRDVVQQDRQVGRAVDLLVVADRARGGSAGCSTG